MGDTAEDQEDQAMAEAAGVASFSELLMLSDDVLGSSDHHRQDNGGDGGQDSFGFVFSGRNRSRMLCFSGGYQNDDESLCLEPSVPSGVSVPDPSSCINSNCKNSNDACTVDKSSKSSNKKRTGSGNGQNPDHDRKPGKRCKRNQDNSSVGIAKVRKERLGERITALQQLVSPYGKMQLLCCMKRWVTSNSYKIRFKSSAHLISSTILLTVVESLPEILCRGRK
ncbi:transcription factor bHLH113 isoform X4 [Eutrema salsugineum]|uniref:transcription factor bHLH113 isoform X4 n=1 Tax=Eutrema salsugineum TaxID=72664 RepID=UPI000CECF94F|nr:transcription factor bHLH113 isoform X4 [Eutrema salsugineum]